MTLREIALAVVFITWVLYRTVNNCREGLLETYIPYWLWDSCHWLASLLDHILAGIIYFVKALVAPLIVCGIIYIIFF